MVSLRGSRQSPTQTVSPGQWVRVEVPDTWPLHMQIGRGSPQPAFLERDGGRTFAQVRCPQLGPGTYPVVVTTPQSMIETSIAVQ